MSYRPLCPTCERPMIWVDSPMSAAWVCYECEVKK